MPPEIFILSVPSLAGRNSLRQLQRVPLLAGRLNTYFRRPPFFFAGRFFAGRFFDWLMRAAPRREAGSLAADLSAPDFLEPADVAVFFGPPLRGFRRACPGFLS